MPLPFKSGYEAIEFAVKKWLMKNRPIQGISTIPGKTGPFDTTQIRGTIDNLADTFRKSGKDVNKVTVQDADQLINYQLSLKAQKAKKPDMASGGIARVGYFKGQLVKGASWFMKNLRQAYDELIEGKAFTHLKPWEREGLKWEILAQIKQLERGGPIHKDMIEYMRKDKRFKDITKTRSTDPELYEVEDVLLGKSSAKSDVDRMKDIQQKIELEDFDPKDRLPNASGGIAGELHLNRPGYGSGLLVKLAKLLKGKKKDLYKHIDMEKLMKGKDKIKVYSGSINRPSNTWKSFKESAKDFGITPEKYAKDQFKGQWFTPFKRYADSFSSPEYLHSKMRSVDLTPEEIGMAKRYVEKINKKDMLVSMRRKLDIKPYPKHSVTTDENLVLIPRYKLKELEKTKRMKTDYMILEKLKKKIGLAQGGLAHVLGV